MWSWACIKIVFRVSVLLKKAWQVSFKFHPSPKPVLAAMGTLGGSSGTASSAPAPQAAGGGSPGSALTCYGTRRSPACSRRWWAPCSRCRAGSPPLRSSFPTGRSGGREQGLHKNRHQTFKKPVFLTSIGLDSEFMYTRKYVLRIESFRKVRKTEKTATNKHKKPLGCYSTWEQFLYFLTLNLFRGLNFGIKLLHKVQRIFIELLSISCQSSVGASPAAAVKFYTKGLEEW